MTRCSKGQVIDEELELSDYGCTPPPPPPPSGGSQQQGYGAPLSGPTLASWIERVAAFLVDTALYLPFIVLLFVFGATDIAQTGGSAGLALLMDLVILAIFTTVVTRVARARPSASRFLA